MVRFKKAPKEEAERLTAKACSLAQNLYIQQMGADVGEGMVPGVKDPVAGGAYKGCGGKSKAARRKE
jgi:hypothetical protein